MNASNSRVIHLVTKINGVGFMLFHVEHSGRDRWFYRWRIRGPYPPEYLEWRSGVCGEARVVLHPEVARCLIEAQWRVSESDEWCQAALHRCASGSASFRILARDGFVAPNGFRVLALVPGEHVASYVFAPLTLSPGRQARVTGTADGPFADNVLLAAGDFRSYSGVLEVDNLGPSADSFVPDPAAEPRLEAVEGAGSRRLFVRKNTLVQFEPPPPPDAPWGPWDHPDFDPDAAAASQPPSPP